LGRTSATPSGMLSLVLQIQKTIISRVMMKVILVVPHQILSPFILCIRPIVYSGTEPKKLTRFHRLTTLHMCLRFGVNRTSHPKAGMEPHCKPADNQDEQPEWEFGVLYHSSYERPRLFYPLQLGIGIHCRAPKPLALTPPRPKCVVYLWNTSNEH